MFESVDLPAPFSPSSACTSPEAASKSTPSLATTPGKRLVIPSSLTAGAVLAFCGIRRRTGRARARPVRGQLALGAADHAFDQPVHRVEVLQAQPLALLHPQLALLVVERPGELVELAADESLLLRCDQALRLRRDLRAVRGQADQAVLDAPVVEVGVPGAFHGRLYLLQVVRAPVVDRRRQPRLGRELHRVRVVADPRDLL